MTTSDRDDLHDARVDGAWRAASREEPPPSLDDAIRAAARREIGARPHRVDSERAAGPGSLRPQRWWWPLAAAATIAAMTAGLLQLVPPKELGAPATDETTATDMPRAKAPAPYAGAPALSGTSPSAGAPPPSDAEPHERRPSTRDAAAPSPPPAAPRDGAASRESAALKRALPQAAKSESPAAERSDGRSSLNAAAPVRDEPEAHGFAQRPAVAPPPQPASSAPASSRAPAAAPEVATPPAAAGERASADSAQSSAALSSESAGGSTSVRPAPSSPSPAAQRVRAAASESSNPSVGASMLSGAAPAAKARGALPVDEWIALIRRLRDEGRTDEAAKELAAFRAAHADHARLLPPDLRDGQPPPK